MENRTYPIKAKHLIPICGLAKYMNGYPLVNQEEDIKIVKRLLGLAFYNIIFSVGSAFSIAHSLESLLK